MSNPSMRLGPITAPVASAVSAGRLVTLGASGVAHASDTGAVFGAVASSATPPAPRGSNDLSLGQPDIIAVHTAPASLPLETADDFELGAPVYSGADGKAAGTGTVQVGIAVAASAGGKVRTRLIVPVAD